MEGTNTIKRISRKRDCFKESDSGVATTVGTIMALLVFLSLLSLITQQYVPIWMEDKEAYHMDQVTGQFSDLKGTIDNLVMNEYKDYPMYSTVTLGSEGVPMFASRTMGILRLIPDKGGMNLNFVEDGQNREFIGQGNISLDVRNRYFEPQTIVYENGVILLEQAEDAVIRAPPQLTLEENNGEYSVQVNIVDIEGDEERLGGARNIGIISELWSTSRKTFDNPTNVQLDINTMYTHAWKRWLVNETDASGLININGNQLTIDLTTETVSELTVTYSTIQMEISM